MSIRLWDDHESGIEGFASIIEAGIVQSIIPVISPEPSIRTYTSQETGIVHALYWLLKLADETALWISSMRADQKIYASGGLFLTYEGYVKVTGAFKGILEGGGYGLVEISPLTG